MKYKVGDKLKIVDNISNHEFKNGEKIKIVEIDETGYPHYRCESIERNEDWWVREEEVVLADYTWEDFLKVPIGTKVTFESGETLVKTDEGHEPFVNENYERNYEDLEDFKDNTAFERLGKVIKIEEPTYITVYEPQEVVMPEIEEMKRLTDELCKTCDEFIKKIKEK